MSAHDAAVRPVAVPAEFDDAVVWAAWLYYEDELTQGEVAKILGVSRATIVNYLQEARERGAVRILMDPAIAARTGIARALADKFGLEEVLVVPRNDALSATAAFAALGKAGARLLERLVRPGDTIGVSWGRTVLAVAEAMVPTHPLDGVSVVQVTGSAIGKREFSAEFCTSVMARNLGAASINMLAPAVLSTAELRDALLREPMLQRQFELIAASSVIVFGVGGLGARGTMRMADIISPAEMDAYDAAGAVCVLICRFLDAQGEHIVHDFDSRLIGIRPEELRRVPHRLCVAAGPDKVEPLRATLAGRYATHLVTDMPTASRLLDR